MNCNNTEAVACLQEGDLANCIMILKDEIARASNTATSRANNHGGASLPIPSSPQHQQQQKKEDRICITPTATTSSQSPSLKDDESMAMLVEDDEDDESIESIDYDDEDDQEDEEDEEDEVLHSVLIKEGDVFGSDVDDRNLLSFYPCAFVLPDDDDDIDDDVLLQKQCIRRPVVLMYNLALAYHVSAAQAAGYVSSNKMSRQQQEKALESAFLLYRRAMDIVMMTWNEDDLTTMRCLIMAIINNMGYICSQGMDFHGANRCIRILCDMVQSEASNGHSVVPIEDYNIFFQSVVTYIHAGGNGELTLAPAA